MTKQRFHSSRSIVFLLSVLIVVPVKTMAQTGGDQVWIEPAAPSNGEQVFAPRSLIRKRGSVQSFDEKAFVFIPQGETDAIRIVAARVIWVEPEFRDAGTIAAVQAFRDGKTEQSIPLLLDAITSGPPVWQAQWLSMHLWQAAFEAQKFPATLELVKQLDARPLPPIILGGLPIQWSHERMPVAAAEAARTVLATALPASRNAAERLPASNDLGAMGLAAASRLLSEPDNRMAMAALRELSLQKERPILAQMATALLWRIAPPPDVIANHASWTKKIDTMPMTLAPGPSFLVAERLEAAGKPEEALPLFLSVAVASPRPHVVTRSARLRSVELLKQLQLPGEAAKLDDNE